MNDDSFTTFSVRVENAFAWVTFNFPPVNIQGLPALASRTLSLAMRFMAAPEDSQICKARLPSSCWPMPD